MPKRLKFSHIEVSYLEAAPDHGQPEIAVVFPNRLVPVAVGEEATRLWKYPPGEEGFLALAYASAEVVSPRG